MSPAPPPPTLALSPGPIPAGSRAEWAASGRTLAHALSPATAELALFATPSLKEFNPAVPPPPAAKGSSATFPGDRGVFLARWDAVPLHLVPLYSRTYTIFQSLQQIAAQTASGEPGDASNGFAGGSQALPTASQISFYSRVCSLYIDTIRQHLLPPADGDDGALAGTEPSTSSSSAGPVPFPEADLARWSHTLSTLHLARILYMPADGRGDGVVGEELLDWVNLTDCGPTEEEGEAILAGPGGAHAWRHPEFWSYLLRSLLRGFLSSAAQLLLTLGSHPASQLAALAPRLAGHLAAYPRSSSEEFATERAFVQAHAQWRASLRLLTRPLTPGWARASWLTDGEDVEGEAQAVEESVGALVELLAGGEARVLEESVDWKEALGAWGVWVRPGLKRDDLPSTVDHILAALPLAAADDDDEEDEEDGAGEEAVQTALLRGDCTTAATAANECSLWLATHLTDLLGHLGLIPRSPAVLVRRAHAHGGPVLGRSLRDHYVLEYAGHLAADRALWQLASNYAGRVAGPEGRMTVGALLSAVSLDREVDGDAAEGDDDEEPRVDQEKVEEILKLMHEHGLEEQARALARTVAERLVREREFGLAVAFGVRASDARKLETIADRVLDVYVRQGPAPFVNHVESIPTSLLDPLNAPPSSVGAPTLAFLPLYRQFLAAYDQGQRDVAADVLVRAFRSGLAPRAFWAVLMVDLVPLLDDADMLIPTDAAYLLLKHLEDLLSSSIDAPAEHLTHLANLRASSASAAAERKTAAPAARTDDEWRDVRKSLDVVRLALARYLARDLTM